jgi:lauroyl/myristoyl acyltransferase
VLGRLATVLAVVAVVLLAALGLAFRNAREVLLSVAAVALGLLLLLAVMSAARWEWNLMNLLALPLMLGTGIDYGIHMQLALRRSPDRRSAMRGVGRALLLCAATTVVGFGSLGFSSNAGLASLGRVCAAGVACMAVAAIGLLPAWWDAFVGARAAEKVRPPAAPPRIYRAFFWRCGLSVARVLPRRVLRLLCRRGARVFRWCVPARVETVVANLLPVFDGDRAAAEAAARRVFDEFGLKLADLWRAEAGHDIAPLVRAVGGWEALDAAQAAGRGLLLITPHLGNWEFGAPLILRRGLTLNVLTLAEPGADFTALRDAARRRGGVRTHVVGGDPFAFVEIIKRLQSGEAVALLMDRPPSASAVRVELFGKPFDASIAVAELARASGAAVLPVTVCRDGDAYAVRVLGEVNYDRAALGDRAARIALTGEILRAFEPSIRQHPDQWFHFVPLWPR